MIICGRDTSRKSKHPTRDCVLHYVIKFISASLPIVAALFVSNLVYVLKYAGITGFFICFLFPTALQLRSIWVCSKEFSDDSAGVGVTVEMKKIGKVPLLDEEEKKGEKEKEGEEEDGEEKEQKKGSAKKRRQNWSAMFGHLRRRLSLMFSSYETPYSSKYLSHPVAVVLIGSVGVILLLLGVSSLGVHPEPIFCQDQA